MHFCRRVAPSRERGLKLGQAALGVLAVLVAPSRERGLKLEQIHGLCVGYVVAPSRERGLKQQDYRTIDLYISSLPHGSVD